MERKIPFDMDEMEKCASNLSQKLLFTTLYVFVKNVDNMLSYEIMKHRFSDE